ASRPWRPGPGARGVAPRGSGVAGPAGPSRPRASRGLAAAGALVLVAVHADARRAHDVELAPAGDVTVDVLGQLLQVARDAAEHDLVVGDRAEVQQDEVALVDLVGELAQVVVAADLADADHHVGGAVEQLHAR